VRGDDEPWIDPDTEDEIWGRVEIETEITKLNRELDAMTGQLLPRARAAAQARRSWRVESAKTRLLQRVKPGNGPGGRMTEGEVEDFAIRKHEDLYLQYKITEADYETLRDAIFTKRDQLKSLQSIAANIRAES
jgi:hypothetical protein